MSQNDAPQMALAWHIDTRIISGLARVEIRAPQRFRIGRRCGQVAQMRPGAGVEFMQGMREDPRASYQVMRVADRGITPGQRLGTVQAVR
jgi:hypothetical protein